MVFFAVLLVGVGEGYLDVVAFEMDDLVERGGVHRVLEQVFQAVAADDTAAVVVDFKSCVEVGVVAKHVVHKLVLELVVEEQRTVGLEVDEGAVLFCGVFGLVIDELAFLFKTNRATLCRDFKKSTGKTLVEFVNSKKFETAKYKILSSSDTFTKIAEELNFESIHYFTRFFKKMSGMTPKDYRKKGRKQSADI